MQYDQTFTEKDMSVLPFKFLLETNSKFTLEDGGPQNENFVFQASIFRGRAVTRMDPITSPENECPMSPENHWLVQMYSLLKVRPFKKGTCVGFRGCNYEKFFGDDVRKPFYDHSLTNMMTVDAWNFSNHFLKDGNS